jgi:hypothetical protein
LIVSLVGHDVNCDCQCLFDEGYCDPRGLRMYGMLTGEFASIDGRWLEPISGCRAKEIRRRGKNDGV